MSIFKSSQLIVNDVMAWANRLFSGHIPLLPFPASWGQTLTTLWRADIAGDLPDPGDPKPWRIDIVGPWRPFTTCAATLESLAIVIEDTGQTERGLRPGPIDAPQPAPRRPRTQKPRRKRPTPPPRTRKRSRSRRVDRMLRLFTRKLAA